MKMTYFDLVNAALLVTALLCNFAAGEGLYGTPFSPVTVGLSVFVIAATAFYGGRLRDSAVARRTVWARPVSDRVGRMIINGLMVLWLAFVFAIGVYFVAISKSIRVAGVAIILTLLATYLGRKLGKRFSQKSLLGYGVTALGALLVFLGFAIIAH